ncbi:MAG: DUF1844 domain-containing protein [Deltaproteobacteria bacterium]|nr:DUF1844 domain-containing protein [Deltaproteobacteria bacterium]
MADEKRNEEKEKSFVVRDKRFTAQKEEEKVSPGNEKMEEPLREEVSGEEVPLPEINFTSFILSLGTSALIQLGEIEDPFTKKQLKNLPIAKQTIDLIGMLREKTKGNLTSEEGNFLDNVLFDLRMRYVKATG